MKLDKFLVAVSISIFLLAGLFFLLEEIYAGSGTSFVLAGLAPAGFLGWATFYAAGAGIDGLKKGIPANLSGILWAVVIVFIWQLFDFSLLGAFVSVAVGAGMMCFQAHIKLFSFIPGAFIGCSTFFALGASISDGSTLWPSVIGLILGLLFGYVSEKFAVWIQTKVLKG